MGEEVHPLLSVRKEGKTALIVVTADRGLCGGYNTSILRQAQNYLKENPSTVLLTVGKKGRDFFKSRNVPIPKEWLYVFPTAPYKTPLYIRHQNPPLFLTPAS